MSEDRVSLRSEARHPGLTPWVGRLMVANAVVFLLLATVVTAPAIGEALRFEPGQILRRPWTFFSYMFVHAGPLHLVANLLGLFVFGPSVERRMGGRAFILYYLYCGVGAAALALGLSSFMVVAPLLGASGAVLGVALAFALAWPDEELALFPIPIRISAKTLVIFLAGLDLIMALWVVESVAHVAHLGGMAAGYAFFRIQSLTARRTRKEPTAVARRPIMAPIPVRQGSPAAEVRPVLAGLDPREGFSPEELDRLLDKISASGIQSLTTEERRFLDEVSKRKRKDLD